MQVCGMAGGVAIRIMMDGELDHSVAFVCTKDCNLHK